MQVRIDSSAPWEAPADVLVIPVIGEPVIDGRLAELDRRSGGEIGALARFGELPTKRYQTGLAAAGELPHARLLVVGAGDAASLDREVVRRVAASAVRRLAGRSVRRLAIWLEPLVAGMTEPGDREALVAELAARGVIEGSFDPRTPYEAEPEQPPVELDELILVVSASADVAGLAHVVARGTIIAEGTNLTRRLANTPANETSPEVLAEEAWSLAETHGLWVDVVGPDRAAELGMGMFLAVGRGSDSPPRMIVMRSGGAGEHDLLGRHLAIVGKGVTFDSGGISIKPSARMGEMKLDKTGACTVIAAIVTLARLAPGTPLLAVAPAVENLPGPHSTRPGDVVRAMNGKAVEIADTDAEGRLILGDAMTYAERLGATHLVDVATLTGAVSRALGHLVTGAFGAPQAWYDDVAAAGKRAGERYWQMPLVDDYRAEMESWYTTLANSGSAEGSLVKSALFLREFVTRPWVHLDIGATAYFRKVEPYAARGATGASLATLVELAVAGARPTAAG